MHLLESGSNAVWRSDFPACSQSQVLKYSSLVSGPVRQSLCMSGMHCAAIDCEQDWLISDESEVCIVRRSGCMDGPQGTGIRVPCHTKRWRFLVMSHDLYHIHNVA